MALSGYGTVSYKIKTELIAGTDNNIVGLTRSLNLFQMFTLRSAENIRISRMRVLYKPRTGHLGSGMINAMVKDNRIDADLGDQIIHQTDFPAGATADITWTASMWLAKSDLQQREPPLVFEMELTECNITAGFSVGSVTIVIDVTGSKTMDRFHYKAPIATIRDDVIRSNALLSDKKFEVRDSRVAISGPITRTQSMSRDIDMGRLRRVAELTRSTSNGISNKKYRAIRGSTSQESNAIARRQ
nr:movement protein [Cytorhabdovirus fragariarugosus]